MYNGQENGKTTRTRIVRCSVFFGDMFLVVQIYVLLSGDSGLSGVLLMAVDISVFTRKKISYNWMDCDVYDVSLFVNFYSNLLMHNKILKLS